MACAVTSSEPGGWTVFLSVLVLSFCSVSLKLCLALARCPPLLLLGCLSLSLFPFLPASLLSLSWPERVRRGVMGVYEHEVWVYGLWASIQGMQVWDSCTTVLEFNGVLLFRSAKNFGVRGSLLGFIMPGLGPWAVADRNLGFLRRLRTDSGLKAGCVVPEVAIVTSE